MQYIIATGLNARSLCCVEESAFEKGFNRIRWLSVRNVESADASLFSHKYKKTLK